MRRVLILLTLIIWVGCKRIMTNEYDYNLQVLAMPGVVCSYKKCDELGELSSDSLNYHGIWPNRLDGKHPFFCTKDIYIEETMPASLLQTLDTVWTGLYNSTFWFRFHEYTKHGTCFKVPGEDSSFLNLNKLTYSDNHQQLFFQTAVDLYHKSQLQYIIFSKDKVNPTDFQLSELENLITKAHNVNVFALICRQDKISQNQFLENVYLCWDLDLNIINCPDNLNYKTNCHKDKPIIIQPLNSNYKHQILTI